MVAPAPAIPPNRPDTRLPRPCPTSSLLELCSVRVRLSATTEVSRASMDPNMPSTAASTSIKPSSPAPKTGICTLGKPALIAPMRRMPSALEAESSKGSSVREMTVPATSASSCGGTIFLRRWGVDQRMTMVIPASANSSGFTPATNSGRCCNVPITPPGGIACPSAGPNCSTTRMRPIPDMKPEITV